MRAFAIVLLVVALSVAGAYLWFAVRLMNSGPWGPTGGEPATAPSVPPRPGALTATVAGEHGWDLVTRGQQVTTETGGVPRTCGEVYQTMSVVPHSGHTGVTLEVRPDAGQQLVINAVRVRVNATLPLVGTPTYLYHCAGPADPPVPRTRIEGRVDAVYPVVGPFPLQVPAEGYRQDVEVEVYGREAAGWQIEVDYTLDGVPATQPAESQSLVTEPARKDATGNWVWCDRRWQPRERC